MNAARASVARIAVTQRAVSSAHVTVAISWTQIGPHVFSVRVFATVRAVNTLASAMGVVQVVTESVAVCVRRGGGVQTVR